MPSNLIISRVAEFLASFAPFDRLQQHVIGKISSVVEIIYYEHKKTVFNEGDPPGTHCYVVRKGRVNLFRRSDDEDILLDTCGEGDMFGVRSMLSGENYKLTAMVEEEALVYAIPVKQMRSLIDQNAEVSRFFAVGLASGQVIIGHERKRGEQEYEKAWQHGGQLEGVLPYVLDRDLIVCSPEEKIREVAVRMAEKGTGSALVIDGDRHPIGIITDTDFRKKVATGKTAINQPVSSIMSSPVITIRSDQILGDIVLKMMKNEIHHLCITEDGTAQTAAKGIISNHDLLMSQGSSPTIVFRSIRKAANLEELKVIFQESDKITTQLLLAEVPVAYLLEMGSTLRDVLIQRSLELIVADVPALRQESYCFADMGSAGRREQILKTDIDNLIIYEPGPDELKNLLINAAGELNHFLGGCGFLMCQAGTMAHLPAMCLTLEEWTTRINGWIYNPDPKALLNATIFFDLRGIFGNSGLVNGLKKNIIDSIRKQPSFLNYLAKNAVQNPPPLSFFNQFIVETSGEHKNEFDIKKRAIMPLVDAARLFALEHHFYDSVSTVDRFRFVSQHESQNRAIFEEAIHGFEFLLRMRARTGFNRANDGRFIDIGSFDNIEKKIFKEIFHIIRELQKITQVRFQLDFFR
jgi:CBS domain-containing protein